MLSDKIIATYSDRLVQVGREFSLYSDRVVVHAKWISGKEFENVVRLDAIRPEEKRFYVKYRLYRVAGWILAIGMLITAAAVYMNRNQPLTVLAYVGLAVAFAGFVLMMGTFRNRKILFASFMTKEGKPALDLARAGSQVGDFERFVQAVRKQIRSA